jgi:HTH-type transcriptional regulator / antitoxin HigA
MNKLIKTETEYDEVLKRIDEIFDAKPNTVEGDELELLAALVELYEKEKYPIKMPDPVSAIRFRMEQQGLKQSDLVKYIGSKSKVSEVLSGKRTLSLNMIRNLSEKLGIPADVLIKEPLNNFPDDAIMEHGQFFPFTEMFNRGWFSDFFKGELSEAKEQKEELLNQFFGIFRTNRCTCALNRKSECGKEDNHIEDLLLAWRIRVMNLSLKEKLPKWNKKNLTSDFFSSLVHLSYLDDGPKLAKEYLNKAGFHIIIEKHLNKTHLDGSSMFMPDGSPVIALTLRYDRLDSFWFTICHELAHLMLHFNDETEVFFDDMTGVLTEKREKEADTYAKNILIPEKEWGKAGLSIVSTVEQIKYFAERNRLCTAIPAGRIRFENHNYAVFTNLIGNGKVRKLFES